jgi:hypothetical protein
MVYSHRFQGMIQQLVVELGLDVILSDENSPISLRENEVTLNQVADMLGVSLKKVATDNGRVLFKFEKVAR